MCIPIRFYGSTLAILGAHLPADGHRKGHECNVTRRCEALRDLLATRSFDAHLQCMHTILLGTFGRGDSTRTVAVGRGGPSDRAVIWSPILVCLMRISSVGVR